jgi:hypothetical protein
MEEIFEKLIDFTLRKEALAGKARVLFPGAEQWKKIAKEKNDLAMQYELLLKKSSALADDGKEGEKRADYSKSLTISIKEPKNRFATPEAKEKFPHMADLCRMHCGVDIVILMNPHMLAALSLEEQSGAIVQELLRYEEHRTGKFLPTHQLAEKAKKIGGEFLKQIR